MNPGCYGGHGSPGFRAGRHLSALSSGCVQPSHVTECVAVTIVITHAQQKFRIRVSLQGFTMFVVTHGSRHLRPHVKQFITNTGFQTAAPRQSSQTFSWENISLLLQPPPRGCHWLTLLFISTLSQLIVGPFLLQWHNLLLDSVSSLLKFEFFHLM